MSRIFLSAPDISGRKRELVAKAFESNYLAPAGPMLEQFERTVADYTGIAHAVALNSGTIAVHRSSRLLNIDRGDEVWTSSMTLAVAFGRNSGANRCTRLAGGI